MATKVIGYVRVSTKGQADDGVSLEDQATKLHAYAKLYDLSIVRIESDAGLSAKTLDRPGLQSALDAMVAGEAEGLLIPKLDRLSRSIKDWATLASTYFEGEFSLISVEDQINTATATGKAMLNLIMVMAQWESDVISERTKSALSFIKKSGRRLGPPTYKDADAVELICALREEGFYYRQIRDELDSNGYIPPKGGNWHISSIRNIAMRGRIVKTDCEEAFDDMF